MYDGYGNIFKKQLLWFQAAFLSSASDHTLHSGCHNLTFAVVPVVLFCADTHWLHPPLPTSRVAEALRGVTEKSLPRMD